MKLWFSASFASLAVLGSGQLVYHISDIGTGGAPASIATSAACVNSFGVVAGYRYSAADPTDLSRDPFFWTEAGGYVDLTPVVEMGPEGINNSNVIVGGEYKDPFHRYAIQISNGAATTLPSLGGNGVFIDSALGINDSGMIVGYSWINSGTRQRAVYWDNEGIHNVSPDGADSSKGSGINAAGDITGTVTYAGSPQSAFVRSADGTVKVLPKFSASDVTLGVAIANDGTVAGQSRSGGPQHSVLWKPDGTLIDISPSPASSSDVRNINNQHQVLLDSGIWSPSTGFQSIQLDVADNGWQIESLNYINDQGQIAGSASYKGAVTHAILFSPGAVSEPSMIGLLGIGVVCLMRRRITRH